MTTKPSGARYPPGCGDERCDVVTFTDPDDAIEHVSRAACQIGLVALRWPAQRGDGVIAALAEACPTMRLIGLAAFPEAREVIEAVRTGVADVLEKPVQLAALSGAIRRQLHAAGIIVRDEREWQQRLGVRIRTVRQHAGRSLADVAGAAGLTASQLSQIETGKCGTTAWTLVRLAAALSVAPAELLREVEAH
jgi:DNA-binding NtrC family response regulator